MVHGAAPGVPPDDGNPPFPGAVNAGLLVNVLIGPADDGGGIAPEHQDAVLLNLLKDNLFQCLVEGGRSVGNCKILHTMPPVLALPRMVIGCYLYIDSEVCKDHPGKILEDFYDFWIKKAPPIYQFHADR